MTLVNDCQKCTDHDAETKRLIDGFIHEDERTLIAFSLGAMIRLCLNDIVRLSKHQNPRERMKALRLQSEKDFAVQVLGKFVYTFDEAKRAGVEKAIDENYHLKMNFTHQPCPHKEGTPQ